MTATPILETLALEFDVGPDHVRNALEMLDAGLSAPFIGRFRRAPVAALSESMIRRLQRRRQELEDLDRRRGTILRLLEKEPSVTPSQLEAIRTCMDRFELEDLFIPHRRPEPEVQLALDRGLGQLADLLVAPIPKAERAAILGTDAEEKDEDGDDEKSGGEHEGAKHTRAKHGGDTEHGHAPASDAGTTSTIEAAPSASHSAESEPYSAVESATSVDTLVAEAAADASPSASDEGEEDEVQAAPTLDAAVAPHPHVDLRAAMNAQLARACADFVRPDKGIHTDVEALSGALRILSDRLGRNARLRSQVRNMMRKQGVLSVRAVGDEGRIGRHRSLLKIHQPLRQIQGHRLLSIRQAQKERAVNTVITLDPSRVLPKVRATLGKHTHPAYREVLDEVANQALQYRLLPMVEQDVRLELKERADIEALRFLAQHLRQMLLAPPLVNLAVAGIDINAKGDWTIACLDERGAPMGADVKIETADKTPEQLGLELVAVLGPIRDLAVGHGKSPRMAATKIRAALRAAKSEGGVYLVNEAGLSSYANSELARTELPDRSVPARMAISLGRRLQDPLNEILKVDPRHLGLGVEQGLVSKANAKRVFVETIESCTAHVGCDVNRAPLSYLSHLPGLDRETAKKLIARRDEKPITSREELRAEGLLTEAQWMSVAAFLRVPNSSERLDASNLHPEQYPIVRRLLESAGTSVEQSWGRPGSTKGLRRVDFDIDEYTWRDLMREIAYPGRDPRPRMYGPALLEPDTDPVRLTKDRVLEGIVSNVASFGAFVDVGLPADAMVHISEISDRYVRDARELLSIGQVVRARILDASGARLALSLKNVPAPVREGGDFERGPRRGRGRPEGGGERGGDRGGEARGPDNRAPDNRERGGRGGDRRDGGGRGRGPREERPPANVRAAQTRRDGIGARSSGRGGGGGGRGGSGGGGFSGGSTGGAGARREGGRGGDFGDRADREDLARLTDPRNRPTNNPFAKLLKDKKDESSPSP